ncbi:hypothetical protein PR003_g5544 [Phytophthora rubi]|uniref:Uncharacterized protein n=1 Tax=Phytophthora rubi TaxID=129364 RepID=A0A6A3NP60_9STRA|nr:hypothetical protein PR002_g1693 [Phytophthora rubi]KAE9051260.1 hypothetical protein PR001_g1627 [Phytophthora rubi]KAE9350046.1 hypothetical protein PR003_g5544 [Phytophthora rubi]
MFQFYAADGPKFSEEAAEIERFRARHRRLCRGQTPDVTPSPQVEDLDVDDGRTRKISAKWRQQQQQQQQVPPVSNQTDDANWATDSEMSMGFNAFDFSASPEAFYESEQQQEESNNQEEQDDAFKSASLWERRFPGLRQPGGPIRQLPTLGQDALWGGPAHYATQEAQRRVLYYQPQYYA